ncbi:polysaccharide deacetylase family protein [Candidatus Sulfidibacterium hydrothermale]|jgi:alpha-amylase|nr:FliG C-terminal domain-containing protein [Candidatus Sulfidibacterium hydrothermale]UBM62650.1 polysaccharide deacetylase family protein [Candidatus Sulfidibacterium hydrothermale]
MRAICFYFQVHQPMRLRTYRFFDIGEKHDYFDDHNNSYIMRKVAQKNYLPMNALLLDLIKEYGSAFKVSFSISGTALDQFEAYAPDVLESFKRLAETGNVEFLAETYAHSLSALKSKEEFTAQVAAQAQKIEQLFGQKPTTFRNTELIYSDEIGAMVADMGYQVMLTEGAKHVLGWRSPNYMYTNAINPKLKLLLKNFRLSDDIAFRFSQQSWSEWPLTTEKFVGWLSQINPQEEVVNLFMDYETFGEHQWEETGIFDFMRALPARVFSHSDFTFATPKELGEKLQPVAPIHVPYPISWADEERDLTAWLGNELQDEAFDKLYALEEKVKKCDDPQIKHDWLYLQTSDHFYYMCTKFFSDGDVHKYFNPYGTPYEAFINYMNVLSDFILRVEENTAFARSDADELKEAAKTLFEKTEKLARKKTRQTQKVVKEKLNKTKEMNFDDIKNMSDTAVKKLLREIDLQKLSVAMEGAGEEIRQKILPNLGKRARKQFDELEKELKKVKKSDIKKFKKEIEDKLKDLFGNKK